MYRETKLTLKKEAAIKNIITTIGRGFISMLHTPWKTIILVAGLNFGLVMWINKTLVVKRMLGGLEITPLTELMEGVLLIYMAVAILFILFLFGRPLKARRIEKNLLKINFVNAADEVPKVISYREMRDKKSGCLIEFETYGIPLKTWNDKLDEIQSTLSLNIYDIRQGKNRRRVIIEAIPSEYDLPKKIYWEQQFLSNEDFELAIGETLVGREYWDLSVIPHGLIGGSSGSGKTYLLRSLIQQCIMKKAEVYLVDFKGRIDFGDMWDKYTEKVITEKQDLLECLSLIIEVMDERKDIFRRFNCKDIKAYNEISSNKLPRKIIACDEIAALLDKTGASKEDKQLIAEIENQLSQIARLGRAFGIHLIFGIQRPDATILTGQIRSNIDYRICGRADDVLSKIVLDNTSASDAIPKKAQGRFITENGTLIQAYLITEEDFEEIMTSRKIC